MWFAIVRRPHDYLELGIKFLGDGRCQRLLAIFCQVATHSMLSPLRSPES